MRDLHGEIRQARNRAGLSLSQAAARFNAHKGTLSRIESGQRSVPDWLLRLAPEVLHCGDQLDHLGADAQQAVDAADPADPYTLYVPTIVGGKQVLVPLSRRTLLAGAIGAVTVHGTATAAPLDPSLPEHYRRVRKALTGQDSLLGPAEVIGGIDKQFRAIVSTLGNATGELHSQLAAVAARFAETQGWLQDDIGNTSGGQTWTTRALELATVAGATDIAAYILMRRSQQAVTAGDGGMAVTMGQAAARQAVSNRVRAAALQQQARGHALMGDEPATLDAMEKALGLTGSLEPVDVDTLAPWCTADYVYAQRGAALLALGKPRAAVESYEQALAEWPVSYRRERGLHMARQARALVAAGDQDGAMSVGREALVIAAETGSSRTFAELAEAAGAASMQWSDESVRDFRTAVEAGRTS
ncbi:helix-turn-helix domain-containing protein [Saccharopolyspora sp. 6V]|uniref:helix-turn-helix domain-containing protein n=1 Tax=Saccharopolyspora sp. 6V TaxID=2877239 RepID=UPI001CD5E3A2|nr:helix-turn-helix domain-containing protein [Saccharopolyspora sp. 6V]MCA1191659.1 helix-turn-helix transcriptional regulator [Saccharopolyspora sp. 6V]